MSGRLTRPALAILVFLLGLVGVITILVITRWGPGLFDWDSFNYLSAARSFAHGQGLLVPISATVQRPLIQFAPFFPVALSTLEHLPVDLMVAARAFNALLFGLNLGLFACLAWFYTRSRAFTLAASGLVPVYR